VEQAIDPGRRRFLRAAAMASSRAIRLDLVHLRLNGASSLRKPIGDFRHPSLCANFVLISALNDGIGQRSNFGQPAFGTWRTNRLLSERPNIRPSG